MGRLLRNLAFTTQQESGVMDDMLDRHQPAGGGGRQLPQGEPADVRRVAAGRRPPSTAARRSGACAAPTSWRRPAASSAGSPITRSRSGTPSRSLIEYVKTHGRVLFNGISTVIRGSVDGLTRSCCVVPSPLLVAAWPRSAWVLRRSLGARGVRGRGAAVHHEPGLLGADARDALAGHRGGGRLDRSSACPLGIAAAHRPRLYAGAAPGAGSDADAADLRLPHPDPGAVRARRRARV